MLPIAISNADKMSEFDVPMAFVFFVGGVVMLWLRREQATARLERVKKGEMTEFEAKKRKRDWSLSGYTIIVLDLGLAISHYLTV